MKLLALMFAVVLAAPASGAQLLVVGRHGTLFGPHAVRAKRARAHGCRVPARTPLSALLASRLPVRVRDYGACAAGGLYVGSVAGERERGRDGWVYKTAHDAPGIGAAEPSQRTRGHVLWFWCVNGADGCQRTLEVSARRLDAGTVRATVRAYDDNGEGVPASGAVVRCGGVQATAGAGGVATLSAGPECRRVAAMQSGRVRSFAAAVR